ncbi:hypothetical protein Cfla_2858 [Cellulomonas flavigena DSM 20109]|uniref:Secreted protein n=1 Tax=Cellulomonas flavigena (strain ATCC 482 / DSM 20109 / BCRC 11376 / JCM 18109 / NBRC 3775 / NCIMB 8073 / NRS 134) TaxID=446466 RepID=D5UK81_CELFN|nr:hypothetical protein [Cellulomonas flavigena]ADG75742.1 hypothetical protein Cfla_2858 [Cellulomonas flavigena DSM 20109]
MTTPPPRPSRARSAAVAAVLLVGAGAAVATSPGLERCPEPTSDDRVSAFYGPQEYDDTGIWSATPSSFLGGGYEARSVWVHTRSCVSADDVDVPVHVELSFNGLDPEPVPEDLLRTLTVSDGRGRTWSPQDVASYGWRPPATKSRAGDRASASLTFYLPVDVTPPVTLHLGDMSGTVDRLSLDPPDEGGS